MDEEKRPRFFNHDKTWNLEGLRASRDPENDSEISVCEISGEELFFYRADGEKVSLRTHGTCRSCGKLVGDAHLQTHGAQKERWPVHYIGANCTECMPSKKS